MQYLKKEEEIVLSLLLERITKKNKNGVKTAIPLKSYIKQYFDSESAFGDHLGISRQRINQMIKDNSVVVDGAIYTRTKHKIKGE